MGKTSLRYVSYSDLEVWIHQAIGLHRICQIMFVKIWADRKLRDNPATKELLAAGQKSVKLPKLAVIFSEEWIESREAEDSTNPLNSILFETLRNELEERIELRNTKNLFDHGERIDLKPDVIKNLYAGSSTTICSVLTKI